MSSLQAFLILLGVTMTLAACSSTGFAPTPSSQAYQDYTSDLHQSPDVITNSRGW